MTTFQSQVSSRNVHDPMSRAASAGVARVGGKINVGQTERWISGAAGAALVVNGLKQGSLGGLIQAGLGGGLLFRAATGHCKLYDQLGISSAE